MQHIKLLRQLNIFEAPDTSSKLLGHKEAGLYELSDLKKNYPNDETDYASIFDADTNAKVWICARYKEDTYAVVTSESPQSPPTFDFENDPKAISEKELIDLLPTFIDFTYDLTKPAYPFAIEGCQVPQAPPHQNNCCTFVEAILVKAWQNATNDMAWDNKCHGQMMIYSANDYFSPITCLVDREMAVAIDNDHQAPAPWTAIQAWRSEWRGGHTFIVLDYHPETDRILTLESNAAFKLNGVGYRMIGNYEDHPHPTTLWWENESLWTWEKFKAVYTRMKQGKLKVKNVNWV